MVHCDWLYVSNPTSTIGPWYARRRSLKMSSRCLIVYIDPRTRFSYTIWLCERVGVLTAHSRQTTTRTVTNHDTKMLSPKFMPDEILPLGSIYNHVRLSHGNIWYSYEVTRWSVVYYRTCRQTCPVGMMSYWLFVKPIECMKNSAISVAYLSLCWYELAHISWSIQQTLELYLPYAPLPGGGGILPAVSSSVGGGGCRPVLLGGVDLSMSAAVQSASNIVPPSHNSLHPPVGLVGGGGGGGGGSGSGPPLPSLNNGPTLMSRGPPPVTIQPLGSSLAPVLHHDDPDITDAPPNPDVLLALLARNKNLEECKWDTHSCSPIKEESSIPKCGGCQEAILDRYVLRVLERCWHARCLTCRDCGARLTDKCFARNGHVFCKDDFFKRFGTKCAGCGQGLAPSQVVRRAQEFVYHLTCFSCALCSRQLDTGDEFYLMDDRKLVCKPDYEQAKAKESADGGSIDGDQPNKRPRTTITAKQLETLKIAYNNSPKPARHVREQLSQDTGLDMRVVQVWFQNRRAKEKRLKKDAGRSRWSQYFRSMKSNGSGGHSPRHDKLLDKDELKVDLDSSFGHHDLSNDSYSTVVNMGLDGDGSSPSGVGGGVGTGGPPRGYLGATTPPYLSTSRSPSLPPQFPYPPDAGLSVYTTLGGTGGMVPGPASDLSNESSAGGGGGGTGAGYPDFPPSPDSWLGEPPQHPHHHHPHYAT